MSKREDVAELERDRKRRERASAVGRAVRASRAELERDRGQLGLRAVLEHDPRQLPLFDNRQDKDPKR